MRPVGTTVDTGKWRLVVRSIDNPSRGVADTAFPSLPHRPTLGNHFVAANVTLTNISGSVSTSPVGAFFDLRDDVGHRYFPSYYGGSFTFGGTTPPLRSGSALLQARALLSESYAPVGAEDRLTVPYRRVPSTAQTQSSARSADDRTAAADSDRLAFAITCHERRTRDDLSGLRSSCQRTTVGVTRIIVAAVVATQCGSA